MKVYAEERERILALLAQAPPRLQAATRALSGPQLTIHHQQGQRPAVTRRQQNEDTRHIRVRQP